MGGAGIRVCAFRGKRRQIMLGRLHQTRRHVINRVFMKEVTKMLNKRRNFSFLTILAAALLSGCQSAAFHRADVQDNSTDRMTVGKVQKEIRVGMSGADVAQALGSPNIVSTDEERREVWIYDKIATDRAYSSSSGGVNALILGFGGGAAGGVGVGGGSSAGASSTSQRTLTVIIKFDKDGKVRDFAYHTSRF